MSEMQEDPILDKARQLRAAGASVDEVREYLHSKGYDTGEPEAPAPKPVRPPMVADATARRRPGTGTSGDFQAAVNEPGKQASFVGQGVAANVLNAAQGIPGMEAFESAAGALGPLSYRESYNALKSTTNAIPEPFRTGEKFVGGAALASALPKSNATGIVGSAKAGGKAGALFGGLDAALSADPDLSLGDRALGAATGLIGGGAFGTILGGGAAAFDQGRRLFGLSRRVKNAPTLGASNEARREAIQTADAARYGAAESEAAAGGGSSPAIASALNDPRVKGIADDVRESFRLQGKPTDDASVLMQVHRELSQNERALIDRIGNANSSRPLTEREKGDVAAVKRMLREASAAKSVKPALTMEIPGGTHEVEPKIVPGHEPMTGPIMEGTAGRARGDQAQVGIEEGGRVSRTSPRDVQGPAGPAFQLRGQPEKVTPGVSIETPTMRVQTAPAEEVPPLMPSFPGAVEQHRTLAGDKGVLRDATKKARRVMAGTKPNPDKLDTQTPESVQRWIKALKPNEAKTALDAFLGVGKEGMVRPPVGPQSTLAGTLMGFGRPARSMNRLAPFVNALDVQQGRMPPGPVDVNAILKAIGLANSPFANP